MINGKKTLVETEYKPEVIGQTSKSNCFIHPSDFQFLPALDSPLNEPTVPDDPMLRQSFLYVPPPIFVHNYKYDPKYLQKRIFASQQGEHSKLWKASAEWIVNQNDLIALERGPMPPERPNDVSDEMLDLFRGMFEERPIWTSLAIYDHLVRTNETRASILDMSEATAGIFHALSCVAYHVKTGPFKTQAYQ